jgi:3-deoxy-D-manno-octulosonic-acid transferase
MLHTLYRGLWWLAAPVAVARLWWRSRRERGYREHIGERFGFSGASAYEPAREAHAPLLWVHAVSVGETRAAQPLIEALLAAYPDVRILLTHMTPTGRATGEQLFGTRVQRCYLPYDMPHAVRRFLRRWQPAIGVLMETEVWPTLIAECVRAQVPLVLANARMSERSARRGARLGAAARQVFGGFSKVLAQSPADAQRLLILGAREVMVLGNLKFDMTPAPQALELGHRWRTALGARAVWVAASTREGEELEVLAAWRRLQALGGTPAQALLILVPRHPQRFDEVAALLERAGCRYVRRSQWGAAALEVPADVQVLLGDSMGELAAYYAAADLAFIGGSLLPLGGQNLIEACALGVPVVVGPHTFNFTQATGDALASGAAVRVADAPGLAQALRELIEDVPRRIAMGQAGAAFAARHRGATARTVMVLGALLGRPVTGHGSDDQPADHPAAR